MGYKPLYYSQQQCRRRKNKEANLVFLAVVVGRGMIHVDTFTRIHHALSQDRIMKMNPGFTLKN